MPDEQPADVAELSNGEVSCQRSLFPLLSHDPHANVRRLNHADIVASITNGTDWLPGVCSKQVYHLGLVGWRATTADNSWTLAGQLQELNLIMFYTQLEESRV